MATDDIAILGVGMHPWGKWGRNFTEYGIEAANAILGRPADEGVVPLKPDEPHVAAGRVASKMARSALAAPLKALGISDVGPSLVDFL